MTFADRVSAAIATIPTLDTKTAVFVSRSGNLVVVNIGETSVTVPFVGISLPPPGHPVQLQTQNRQLMVTGAARPLPGVGTITATGSPKATVSAWDTSYTLAYLPSYTPVLGDQVAISWSADGGLIQGSMSAAPVVVAPTPNAPSGPTRFTPPPFTATGSGSFGYGGWTKPDVWASDSFTSGWWYGSKIRDSIPDNAQIISASIYLNPRQVSGAAPRLQVHTSEGRPGGALTFTGAQHMPGTRSGWVPIPTAFIDYLKGSPGGVGVNHGGYTIWRGTQADAQSGAISVVYDA